MMAEDKLYAFDRAVFRLAHKYLFEIMFWISILFSVVIRIHLAPQCISGDYKGFITNWVTAYASEPFWKSFGHSITNYYEPYNFLLDLIAHSLFPAWALIALSSGIAEYVTALYLYRIVILTGTGDSPLHTRRVAQLASAAVLYLPMAMMNGALWKQCDAVYTCFAVISLYYFLKEKYTATFVLLAVSFLFKLQAVFILPFYLMMYLCRQKFSIVKFFWLPFLYIVAGIPAILLKRGFHATYLTYFRQTQDVPMMSASSPSIYRFGMKNFEAFGTAAVFITIAVLMIVTGFLYLHREHLERRSMFYIAGWTVMTCFVFLPEMHERYDYMALILLTAFIVAYRHRLIWCMVVMNLCTAMTYSYYLFDFNDVSLSAIAFAYNIAYAVITVDVVRSIRRMEQKIEEK